MNCRRAEQLLPLHAGGDLSDGCERAALAAHLEGCEGCRRAAGEWAETTSLLRQDEPPEFDAAFFDSIRRDVMREIRADNHTARPAFSMALLARLLRPRPLAYAAALALVCAVALLFALRLSRAPQLPKLASDGVASSLNKQLLSEGAGEERTQGSVVAPQPSRGESHAAVLPVRRHRATPVPSPQTRETANAATPRGGDGEGSAPTVALVGPPPTVPPPSSAIPTPELPGANTQLALVKDEREMLKIDLRTGDPDVRIIWFSPQPSEQASPRRSNDKR